MDYKPLSPWRNEIRLLTIHPESSESAPFSALGVPTHIFCSIDTFSLDDMRLRFRIAYACRDYIHSLVPKRIARRIFPVLHDGAFFYCTHFAALWVVARSAEWCVRHFLGTNWVGWDRGVAFCALLGMAYRQHPDFFLLFDSMKDVTDTIRFGYLEILVFAFVHAPIVLLVYSVVYSFGFLSVNVAVLSQGALRFLIWDSEICRPDFSNDTQFRYRWGDYAALSYMWGDSMKKWPIFVDGEVVMVRENLAAALRRYRGGSMAHYGIKLWVDALCINQDDIAEKNVQVQRMLGFYQKAWTVVVWLGEEEDNSAQAMRWINTFAVFQKSIYGLVGRNRVARRVFDSMDKESLQALGCFLARPYWSRMWITQELSACQMNSPFFCGSSATSWQAISDMIEFAALDWNQTLSKLRSTGHPGLVDVGKTGISFSRLRNMTTLFRGQESSAMALARLSALSYSAQATDDRDKVYGCLGLMGPAMAADITPNYQLRVEHVYVNFTKAVISHTRDLSIIHGGRRMELRKTRPTWAVDFRDMYDRFRVGADDPSNACLGRSAEFQVSECTSSTYCDSVLTCKGFFIDIVDGVSGNQADWFTQGPVSCSIEQSTSNSRHAYTNDKGLFAALHRTLIGWRLPDSLIPPQSILSIPWLPGSRPNLPVPEALKGDNIGHVLASEWYDDFESFRHVNAPFHLFGRRFQDFFPQTVEMSVDFKDLAWQMMFVAQGVSRRKLITTRCGYLGLGVEAIRPGDRIFVLLGSKSPVALRACREGYEVVGEVYVHGIMNGEAMGWLDTGKSVLDDIVIC